MARRVVILGAVAVAALLLAAVEASAGILADVKARGEMKCGINGQLPGFAYPSSRGEMEGFDVEMCKALAAAIGVKVRLVPLTAKERFTALQSGEIDVLYRNTSWTFSRDVALALSFQGVSYYDGQGFLVRGNAGVKSAKELDGAAVCVATGTTTELNLSDYFRAQQMKLRPVVFESTESMRAAYEAGRCDVLSSDVSGLAAMRSAMSAPDTHVILPEIISKEPLGPVTRHGDEAWGDTVRWVLNALILAEELGVGKANAADRAAASPDPNVQRLLGKTGSFGKDLGLDADWALRAILVTGNYGEIFARTIGAQSTLKLERGMNRLWSDGGLLFAPPIR
ncbi:MAG: amino acid ABC transporter substrate-binding protein [Candidatus Schekmanbacteria bacterium]|nr:amino acid ABC transporter substrate-binding protein [Candidatus Schekmanbacteria bacterium]